MQGDHGGSVVTTRTDALLADGREIEYYDSSPGRGTPAADRRADLLPLEPASEIRWDPLQHDYAVIAHHRQERTYHPPATMCPLCPSTDALLTEVPEPDYEVVVFENRFPSLSLRSVDYVTPSAEPPFRSAPAAGRCEVVSFTSDHNGTFAGLSHERARTVIDAWVDRTAELSREPTIEYVFCFENRGEEIGVTLGHPHGQIYGYPFVPPRFFRMAETLARHHERAGSCLQCELVAAETADGRRVVDTAEGWVAYVPFAARWPYEVRLVPTRHIGSLGDLTAAEREALATIYLRVLRAFDGLFDTPAPYIAGWQQAPVRHLRDPWHLAAEIFTIRRAPDKLKYLAGSESAAAVWINDVIPEAAAERLRHALATL
jgi:UDPglucose--hexose-1-phosphate uridylyltransferase